MRCLFIYFVGPTFEIDVVFGVQHRNNIDIYDYVQLTLFLKLLSIPTCSVASSVRVCVDDLPKWRENYLTPKIKSFNEKSKHAYPLTINNLCLV